MLATTLFFATWMRRHVWFGSVLNIEGEFRIQNLARIAIRPKPYVQQRQCKPLRGVIKINVDVTIKENWVDIGVIARDDEGFVFGGSMRHTIKMGCAEWEELDTISDGIAWLVNNNTSNIIIKSDCASMVNRINSTWEDITIFGHRIEAICDKLKSFSMITIRWIQRDANKAADKLSSLAIDNNCNLNFDMDYSRDMHTFLITDLS